MDWTNRPEHFESTVDVDSDRAAIDSDENRSPVDGDENRSTADGRSDVVAVADAFPPESVERLDRIRRLSRLLDSAVEIPGTSIRIGFDPILGLLPGIGDATATAASAYVVAEAAALGAPRATLARMLLNLGVDATLGSIPLVGDAFDAFWRANDRNVRLLERRLSEPGSRGARRDRHVVIALGLVVFVGIFSLSLLVFVAAWWLLGVAGVV